MMTFFRPILSERDPKMTKNGEPKIKETAMRMLAVGGSTFRKVWRK